MKIGICLFIFLLQYHLGYQEAVTKVGEKGSTLLVATSDMFKDMKPIMHGSTMNMQKFNTGFRRLSKAFASAGAAFALVGVISELVTTESEQQQMHREIMEEFRKIHDGFESLGRKINGVENLIKHEHAQTRISPHLNKLSAITRKFNLHRTGNGDHATQLEYYYKNSQISDSITGIFEHIIGIHGMNTWLDTTYSSTNGKYISVQVVADYLQLILSEGMTAFTFACELSKRDTKTKSSKDCQKESDGLFGQLADQFQKKINKVLNKCLKDYKTNIEKMLDDQLTKHQTKTNREFSTTIADKIKEDFFWVHAIIVVYNDCSGFSNHCTSAHITRFRKGGRNISIFLSEKPGYCNQFRTRAYLKSASYPSLKKFVEFPLPYLDLYNLNDPEHIMTMDIYSHSMFSGAEDYYDYIQEAITTSKRRFNEFNGFNGFNGFAVVKHGHDIWATATSDNDRYFYLNYVHRNNRYRTTGYSIIGQLKDGYSFFPTCPADFPYAYSFGTRCKTSKHYKDWFNTTSGLASVACGKQSWRNKRLCRDRH